MTRWNLAAFIVLGFIIAPALVGLVIDLVVHARKKLK